MSRPYQRTMTDSRLFRLGEHGSHVRDLQRQLSSQGYPVQQDGVFDSRTQAAIESLEEDFGYFENSTSFCVDPRTLRLLFDRGERKRSLLAPRGTGMVIRDFSHAGIDPSARVEQAKISWLAAPSSALEHRGLRALVEQGTQAWVYNTPSPGEADSFVSALAASVESIGASGAIINVRRAFMDREAEAFDLTKKLRKLGFPVGVKIDGNLAFKEGFPLGAFRELDFGVPRIFHSEEEILLAWKEEFLEVVPMFSSLTPSAYRPTETALWWDWLTTEKFPSHWDLIRGEQ